MDVLRPIQTTARLVRRFHIYLSHINQNGVSSICLERTNWSNRTILNSRVAQYQNREERQDFWHLKSLKLKNIFNTEESSV